MQTSTPGTCVYRSRTWWPTVPTFFVSLAAAILGNGTLLLFINIIFQNVQSLSGWTYFEVVLTYGLMRTANALAGTFLNMPWGLHNYVASGALDTLLIRPANPLFQMVGNWAVNVSGVGGLLVALSFLVYGLAGSGLALTLPRLAYIVAVVLTGMLVYFSVHMMVASIGFWSLGLRSLMYPISWMSDFARFPVVIFPAGIRFVLTWALPFAMTGFYPMAYLLRGGEYTRYGLIAPLMGLLFLGLALLVWQRGLRRYESTGS